MAVSTQSVVALFIGGYASHRGYKALLAGLSFIHDEENQRGFVSFNVIGAFSCTIFLILQATFPFHYGPTFVIVLRQFAKNGFKIDLTITRRAITPRAIEPTYFFAIALIISIAVVFDVNENIDRFINNKAPLKAIVFDYYRC